MFLTGTASAKIGSGASSRRSPRRSPRFAQSFGSFPLPGLSHRSLEDGTRYSRQKHLSASTTTPAARHRFEHFGMLADYFPLLFRGKKKDAAAFILITKGREYLKKKKKKKKKKKNSIK